MDYIKKNKLLLAIIGILVVLNIATVSFIMLAPMRFGQPPKGDPVQRFIEQELNLSADQNNKIADLREEFIKNGKYGPAADADAKRALFDLLKNPNVSEEDIRQRATGIGQLETDRSLAIYRHFRMIRALCTPEQQRKFDSFISDVLMRMGGPPGRPEPPKMPGDSINK